MKKYQILVILLFSVFACQDKKGKSTVSNLHCEYLKNPIGIDAKHPRFSWKTNSDMNSIDQIAYHLVVAPDSLFSGKSKLWDTGKTYSGKNLVTYKGKPLQPFTKYFWRVEIWDNQGFRSSSGISSFETGMMDISNWKGSWITDSRDINLKPAPYFRKHIDLKKKVKNARAYVVVAGFFEMSVNAKKIASKPIS